MNKLWTSTSRQPAEPCLYCTVLVYLAETGYCVYRLCTTTCRQPAGLSLYCTLYSLCLPCSNWFVCTGYAPLPPRQPAGSCLYCTVLVYLAETGLCVQVVHYYLQTASRTKSALYSTCLPCWNWFACTGYAPLPPDSQQDHAEQAEEEGQDGQVVLHPHHQETGAIYCNNAKHLLCILRPGQNDVIVSYFSKN